VSEGSFYEAYDPFEYMVTKAQQLQTEEDQVSMLKATFLHY
jgi:hypothetical protein